MNDATIVVLDDDVVRVAMRRKLMSAAVRRPQACFLNCGAVIGEIDDYNVGFRVSELKDVTRHAGKSQ